jgi:hypothetical protein
MSLTKIWTDTKGWLNRFLADQAEMAALVETFSEELPWRTRS